MRSSLGVSANCIREAWISAASERLAGTPGARVSRAVDTDCSVGLELGYCFSIQHCGVGRPALFDTRAVGHASFAVGVEKKSGGRARSAVELLGSFACWIRRAAEERLVAGRGLDERPSPRRSGQQGPTFTQPRFDLTFHGLHESPSTFGTPARCRTPDSYGVTGPPQFAQRSWRTPPVGCGLPQFTRVRTATCDMATITE